MEATPVETLNDRILSRRVFQSRAMVSGFGGFRGLRFQSKKEVWIFGLGRRVLVEGSKRQVLRVFRLRGFLHKRNGYCWLAPTSCVECHTQEHRGHYLRVIPQKREQQESVATSVARYLTAAASAN